MKFFYSLWSLALAVSLITVGCAPTSPLIQAAANGDSKAVYKLIGEGAPINEADRTGVTPLMHAVWTGNSETAKILINKGADINKQDKDGHSALTYAVIYSQYELAEVLLRKGANFKSKTKTSETAIHYAASACDIRMTQILIDNGADIDIKTKDSQTALHYAADSCDGKLTDFLLSNNANSTIKDATGWTPLRHAIFSKNIDSVAVIRKRTNWQEDIDSLSMDEALRSPSYYRPEQNMFKVSTDQEAAFKIATTDCNLIVIPNKTGLLFATGGVGYGIGLAADAVTIKGKFQKCMEKMGFECINNCSR
jgi:ankyrin repeat protein